MANENNEVVSLEGSVEVSRTVLDQETTESETLRVRPFLKNAPIGSVTVRAGRTLNLGNYESARIDVTFQLPGYIGELGSLYRVGLRTVNSYLDAEVGRIERQFGLQGYDTPIEDQLS